MNRRVVLNMCASSAGDEVAAEGEVREIDSKSHLDYILNQEATNKLVVLEVRRQNSKKSKEFEPKYKSIASDFKNDAIFASLMCDKNQKTKDLAKTLMEEEVPAVRAPRSRYRIIIRVSSSEFV